MAFSFTQLGINQTRKSQGLPQIAYGNVKPAGDNWVYQGTTRNPTYNPNVGWSTTGYWTQQQPAAQAPQQQQEQPKQEQPKQPTVTAQDPTPLDVGQSNPYQSQIDDLIKVIAGMNQQQPVVNIDIPKAGFAGSTAVDGNATGFTRAKSAAKRAGLTNKGTARLRINRTGQTTASSGLNIGV